MLTVVDSMDGGDLAAQCLHAEGGHCVADIAFADLVSCSFVLRMQWLYVLGGTHPDVTLYRRQYMYSYLIPSHR